MIFMIVNISINICIIPTISITSLLTFVGSYWILNRSTIKKKRDINPLWLLPRHENQLKTRVAHSRAPKFPPEVGRITLTQAVWVNCHRIGIWEMVICLLEANSNQLPDTLFFIRLVRNNSCWLAKSVCRFSTI